uniref:Uncharacterized protein n=1 Tax=Compsopogon caeruleus TaxID=31354 RepID=A0A7S1TJ28_9RHOD
MYESRITCIYQAQAYFEGPRTLKRPDISHSSGGHRNSTMNRSSWVCMYVTLFRTLLFCVLNQSTKCFLSLSDTLPAVTIVLFSSPKVLKCSNARSRSSNSYYPEAIPQGMEEGRPLKTFPDPHQKLCSFSSSFCLPIASNSLIRPLALPRQ